MKTEKEALKVITQAKDLEGKKVLVRSSLNTPLEDGTVRNTFRLERAAKTIQYLKKQKAQVIVVGHLTRDPKVSLGPVCDSLSTFVKTKFIPATAGRDVEIALQKMKDGDIIMLENIRSQTGETNNDTVFAKTLASYADIFVNDAFSVSHRNHASIVGVPYFLPAYIGMQFENEHNNLLRSLYPESPSLFLLGGAKFETKMPLIEKYVEKYDKVFVGGALANDILKARGYEVGVSLVSNVDLHKSSLVKNDNLIVPLDVVVYGPDGKKVRGVEEVLPTETILDAGPETITQLIPEIQKAKTILWNGPLGDYERGFDEQTKALGKLVAESSAFSVLGGGDTIAAIEELDLLDSFGFVSTAGGAMLKFLEDGTLPGIEALRKNS